MLIELRFIHFYKISNHILIKACNSPKYDYIRVWFVIIASELFGFLEISNNLSLGFIDILCGRKQFWTNLQQNIVTLFELQFLAVCGIQQIDLKMKWTYVKQSVLIYIEKANVLESKI